MHFAARWCRSPRTIESRWCGKNDRKIEVMRPYLARQASAGRAGVAAIGVAQEFAPIYTATKHTGLTSGVWFSFAVSQRRVTCYYFYIWHDDSGRGSSRSAPTFRIR